MRELEHYCSACNCGVDGYGKCPCGCDDQTLADVVSDKPWPVVGECFSKHIPNHSCAQCDGSHDHRWVAGAESTYATPVRCRVCGGRKCDMPRCRLRRHHSEDHEEF